MLSTHALWMKLHSPDGQLRMANRHEYTVIRPCNLFEMRWELGRRSIGVAERKRVIAHNLKALLDASEEGVGPRMGDGRKLTMHRAIR